MDFRNAAREQEIVLRLSYLAEGAHKAGLYGIVIKWILRVVGDDRSKIDLLIQRDLTRTFALIADLTYTYFRPAIISMAELKFPVFQQVSATRRRQDSTACRSSIVAPLVIAWVTHELTWLTIKDAIKDYLMCQWSYRYTIITFDVIITTRCHWTE